jgi:hypothetical protein
MVLLNIEKTWIFIGRLESELFLYFFSLIKYGFLGKQTSELVVV